MYRPFLFVAQTIVVLVVAATHIAALQWYLYWQYPWLDIVMHFLGGLWVALISAWLMAYVNHRVGLVRVMAAVMLVGIGWEFFELVGGIVSPSEAKYPLDTVLDLCMDFCGGLFGFLAARELMKERALEIKAEA